MTAKTDEKKKEYMRSYTKKYYADHIEKMRLQAMRNYYKNKDNMAPDVVEKVILNRRQKALILHG